jgi:tRNA (guanine-N7-)-methyltransferase
MIEKQKDTHHFYGRRKLRALGKERVDAVEKITGQYILPESILDQDIIDPKALLQKDTIWFEIGFGNGEHLIGQAQNNPDIGFIGCEPFMNGAAWAAREIVTNDISNVRIWQDDALPLLSRLPEHSLDRLFLLFPDPWPKTRHYKRRFIQTRTIELLARLIKPGGRLSFATDDKSLAEWMLLHTASNPDFSWDNWQDADWSTTPADWVETRYQQKAAQQGRLARFLNFTRV